jgi:hypothetical protein
MKTAARMMIMMLAAGSLLSSGCASWPGPIKVIATPVAVARDVVDLPLTSIANFGEYLAESSAYRTGNTDSGLGYGFGKGGGLGLGMSMDLTSPFGKLISWIFALPDYLLTRSFCGSLEGESPWKKYTEDWSDHLFPNYQELWSDKRR